MERRPRRGSLAGPVILIGLGVVFLLNNLGIVSWSVWDVIFNLWPVLLIAAGLDVLIGRRSGWGTVVSLLLTLAVLAGALWVLGVGLGQATTTEEIAQPLDGATRAEIEIAPVVGALRVESLPESANLVEGTLRLRSGERLVRQFEIEDETATFVLRSEGNFVGPFGGAGQGWDLALNPGLSLDLATFIAVGQTDLDLTGLTVSDLEAGMAMGQITIVLPGEGSFRAKVDGAIGQIIIVVPEGMEARVRLDTALVGRQLPDEYQSRDDVYTSPGYAGAENRVDLEVNLAMGSVVIRH
ncbi:MAG: cell wall-active antibiotics response protein [Chloroflexi bacterium]|nr:cell wall-active antibiotics response protein [Chloroflexota bacterium]